jgi:hypothetical protein
MAHFSELSGFLPVRLPWFIFIHACLMVVTGLVLIFQMPEGKRGNSSASLGIATFTIGLAYLFTAWPPMEENAFLYASVPVRLILSTLALVRALGFAKLERKEKNNLIGIAVWDGCGALVLGWYLGEWSGRPTLSY